MKFKFLLSSCILLSCFAIRAAEQIERVIKKPRIEKQQAKVVIKKITIKEQDDSFKQWDEALPESIRQIIAEYCIGSAENLAPRIKLLLSKHRIIVQFAPHITNDLSLVVDAQNAHIMQLSSTFKNGSLQSHVFNFQTGQQLDPQILEGRTPVLVSHKAEPLVVGSHTVHTICGEITHNLPETGLSQWSVLMCPHGPLNLLDKAKPIQQIRLLNGIHLAIRSREQLTFTPHGFTLFQSLALELQNSLVSHMPSLIDDRNFKEKISIRNLMQRLQHSIRLSQIPLYSIYSDKITLTFNDLLHFGQAL